MKTIYKDEYNNDGIFIDLEHEYEPYNNLLSSPESYLDKNNLYYFFCLGGIKSGIVTAELEKLGYQVVQVLER